jgi:hypothetical protein
MRPVEFMPTINDKSIQLAVSENIEDRIYVLRGQRVMLDSDLAEVYGVTTKRLNEQVRRNVQRFPSDFVFQLTEQEFVSLRNWSQIATSSNKHRGTTYRPYAFTEHGAVMLASVLNSPTAVEASIVVVRAFVKMRAVLSVHKDLATKIEQLSKIAVKHDNEFDVVFQLLREITDDPKYLKRKIGFVETKKNSGGKKK